MTKTIFITGASSGLGKLTAFHFAKRGWNVAATMRTPEKESELSAYDKRQDFQAGCNGCPASAGSDGASHRCFREDRRSGQQCWRWLLRTSGVRRRKYD